MPQTGVTGTEVSLAAEPDTGWEFKQWRVNSGGVAVEDDLFTIGMEDVVITAVFKPQTFTVTFVNYDGAELQSSEVAYGQTPKYEGAEPTRPDSAEFTYAFVGWTPEIAKVTGDATYTATYEATPVPPKPAKKATLTFDLAGGTLDGKTGTITIEANVGDTIKLPAAPTREGYTFKFWKGSEYAADADYVVPEGGHGFTAEWEKNADSTPSDTKPTTGSNSAGGTSSATKSASPATGDNSAMLIVALSVTAIGSLLVLAACASRRKVYREHRSR